MAQVACTNGAFESGDRVVPRIGIYSGVAHTVDDSWSDHGITKYRLISVHDATIKVFSESEICPLTAWSDTLYLKKTARMHVYVEDSLQSCPICNTNTAIVTEDRVDGEQYVECPTCGFELE